MGEKHQQPFQWKFSVHSFPKTTRNGLKIAEAWAELAFSKFAPQPFPSLFCNHPPGTEFLNRINQDREKTGRMPNYLFSV